ncbi:MAG: hypothetical protein GXP26_09315 [Planctomycetes bacterium]|nr:hypothetical protein [Planctomycetota bacterium]
MQIPKSRDNILIDEYEKIPDKSSEAIIRNPELSDLLLQRVNRRLPNDQRFEQEDLNHRLENLRKSSQLPKKFRGFNGRDLGRKKPK